MNLKELLPKIEEIILPFLDKKGIELVEISAGGSGKIRSIKILLWKEGGLDMGRVSGYSRHIGDLLDTEDIIPGKYYLEVSTPGLDRPLRSAADFRRAHGERVKLKLTDDSEAEGEIIESDAEKVVLENEEEQESIPLADIAEGRIIIEI